MGRQHRVILGATGRGEREAYSASSAVPSTGGFTVGTGRDARSRCQRSRAGGSTDPGTWRLPLGPTSVNADRPHRTPPHAPETGNCSFWLVRVAGLCVCLPRIPQVSPHPPNPPSVRGVVRNTIARDPSKSLSPSFFKHPNLERICIKFI